MFHCFTFLCWWLGRRQRAKEEREKACEALCHALTEGINNANTLRNAIRMAKQAGLEGVKEDGQTRW